MDELCSKTYYFIIFELTWSFDGELYEEYETAILSEEKTRPNIRNNEREIEKLMEFFYEV